MTETEPTTVDPMMGAINIRKCPRHLRSRFKAYCADREVDMQEALIRLMELALDEGVLDIGRVN